MSQEARVNHNGTDAIPKITVCDESLATLSMEDANKQLSEKISALHDYIASVTQSCTNLAEQESRVKSELELQRDIVQSSVGDAFTSALQAISGESLACKKQHVDELQSLGQELEVMEKLVQAIQKDGDNNELLQQASQLVASKLDCRTQHARINVNFPRQHDVAKSARAFFDVDLLNMDIITLQWPKPQLSRECAPRRFRSMSNPYVTADRWKKAWIVKTEVEDFSFNSHGNLIVVTQHGLEVIKSTGAMHKLLDASIAMAKVADGDLVVALTKKPIEMRCYKHDSTDDTLELIWSHAIKVSATIGDYKCLSVKGDMAALLVSESLWLYRVSDGVLVKTLVNSPEGCQLFQDVYCVHVSHKNRFILSEGGDDNSVKAIDHDGRLLWRYGGSIPSESTAAWKPFSVCDDNEGQVYVADYANNKIAQVSSDGRFIGYALVHRDGINQARQLAFFGKDTLAVNMVGDSIGKVVMVFQKMA